MRSSFFAFLALGLCGAVQSRPATAYLEDLPLPPDSICVPMPDERTRSPDGTTEQERFETRVGQLTDELLAEIDARSRAVKEAGKRGTLKPAQEAAMGQPGVSVAETDANKKLTPQQRREAAMKKIEQVYGVKPAEIDKLKQMKKEGNLTGLQGWGQAVTAERQAAAEIDPARMAQAQRDTMETAALAEKQSKAAQRIAAAVGKHTERFRELAESDDQKRLMATYEKHLYLCDKDQMEAEERRQAEEHRRNPGRQITQEEAEALADRICAKKESCEAKTARTNMAISAAWAYCKQLTPQYVYIVQDFKRSLLAHQGDYAELDRIQGEIGRLQLGNKPALEQQGLSMLRAARDYAQWLAKAYLYKLTNEQHRSAANCGKLGS